MAKIWFIKEGEGQRQGADADKPFDWCVEKFRLQLDRWRASPETRGHILRPRANDYTIIDETRDPAKILIFGERSRLPIQAATLVVITVDENELARTTHKDWRPGFYVPDVNVEEAKRLLAEPFEGQTRES